MLTGKRQAHCRSPLISARFLWIWQVCAQYTAPWLCLVIYFVSSCIKVGIFIERDPDVKRFSISPLMDVPTFFRLVAVEESTEQCCTCSGCVCVWARDEQTICLNIPLSASVVVYVFILAAWVSQFEMQHLQMCLVNCSRQLLPHSAGTIETKQLKSLSPWGDDLVHGCAWLIFPLFQRLKSLNRAEHCVQWKDDGSQPISTFAVLSYPP